MILQVLVQNSAGPGDPSSMFTSLPAILARMYFNVPDAVSFAGGVEAVVVGGGVYSRGKIYGLTGNIRGQSKGFDDVGMGVGVDGGGGLNVTEYYFVNLSGNKYSLSIGDFEGQRLSAGGDVNIFDALSLGFGLAIAPVGGGWDSGMYILSKTYSYGLGVEGLPLNGNINYGQTTLHKK